MVKCKEFEHNSPKSLCFLLWNLRLQNMHGNVHQQVSDLTIHIFISFDGEQSIQKDHRHDQKVTSMTSCGQKLASFFKMSGHPNFLTRLLKISLRNILLIEKYSCKIIFTALSNIHSMVLDTIFSNLINQIYICKWLKKSRHSSWTIRLDVGLVMVSDPYYLWI